MVGSEGLYPSRSELIRVAVREFLIKELKMAKRIVKFNEPEDDDFDEENFVRVPIESKNDDGEQFRTFKTYKIIKRLEY